MQNAIKKFGPPSGLYLATLIGEKLLNSQTYEWIWAWLPWVALVWGIVSAMSYSDRMWSVSFGLLPRVLLEWPQPRLRAVHSARQTVPSGGIFTTQDWERDHIRLVIHAAIYGFRDSTNDVVSILRGKMINGVLDVLVNNDILGPDPCQGQEKTLRVEYSIGNGPVRTVIKKEHERLQLPEGL